MRVTVVSPYLPHPNIAHGGGVAVRGMLRWLAKRHTVTLVPLLRAGEDGLVDATAADLGAKVVPVPFRDARSRGPDFLRVGVSRLGALLRATALGTPYYIEKYASRATVRGVIEAVAASQPEAVQFEYFQSVPYLRALRAWIMQLPESERPGLFLSSHELGSLPRERRSALAGNILERRIADHQAAAWRRFQVRATKWADRTFCVTDQDRVLLEADGGRNCLTIPLGMDTATIRPDRVPVPDETLLFVGSFGHRPNRTAVELLIDKVWPEVSKYHPEAVLQVIGSGSREFLHGLARVPGSVVALGYVEDLDDNYRRARLLVAPLTEGGGIKIKILEAMAHGLPVVTTPIGAEGIVAEADRALWTAPPDHRFAAAVLEALAKPEEAAGRARRARIIIEERFSWSAITEMLTACYEGR
jgi:glycosyltransferase involved in cell wall biosynthesis